ncbi:hypothetical protein WMF18_31745 [Sorangium sp. So ce315]|uniref:hypothetical protein n=1 Tax=Sorangium sp. So ce315 TaxID=3133299 RepID=UPI003F61683A
MLAAEPAEQASTMSSPALPLPAPHLRSTPQPRAPARHPTWVQEGFEYEYEVA